METLKDVLVNLNASKVLGVFVVLPLVGIGLAIMALTPWWPLGILFIAGAGGAVYGSIRIVNAGETAGLVRVGQSVGGLREGLNVVLPGLDTMAFYPRPAQVYKLEEHLQVTTGQGTFGGMDMKPITVPIDVTFSINYPSAGNVLPPWHEMKEFSDPTDPHFIDYAAAIPGLAQVPSPEKVKEVIRHFPNASHDFVVNHSILPRLISDAVEAAAAEWPWLRIKQDRVGFEKAVLAKLDPTFTLLLPNGTPLRHNGRLVQIPLYHLFEDFSVAATLVMTAKLNEILHTMEEAERKVNVALTGVSEAMHLQRQDEIRAGGVEALERAKTKGKVGGIAAAVPGADPNKVLAAHAAAEAQGDLGILLAVGEFHGDVARLARGGKGKSRSGGNNGGGRGNQPAGSPAGGPSGNPAPTPPKGKGGSGNPSA